MHLTRRPRTPAPLPRRQALLALLLGPALAACGDDAASTEGVSSSTGGATTGDPTTGPGSDPTTVDPSTPTTEPTTAAPTSDPTTAGPTSDPGTDTTDTTADPTTGSTTDTTGQVSASTTDNTTTTDGSSSTGDELCAQGTILCEGNTAKVCDGLGGFESEENCPKVCAPGLGCSECIPGEGSCDGPVAQLCNEEGTGYQDTFCDEVQGVMCDPNAGECVGACAPKTLGTSYIGCQYYPVITPNVVGNDFSFAVVVSNVSNEDADITITKGGQAVVDIIVPKNTVEVIPLPWVAVLKSTGPSRFVPDGAYRLRSTQPVTVYQYNPLEYQKNGGFSFTNDASLLMPTNVWGDDTFVVIRNTLNGLPGVYSVIGQEDNTKVTLTPSATGKVVVAGGGVAADGTGVVMIGEGDVLQVLSGVGGGEPNGPDKADLTGTRVVSDKPVNVLSGHACSYVPYNILACDHLEETNLPFANLAKEYLVTCPLVKAPNQNPTLKARIVRVTATTDATTLTYDPPQNGAPAALAKVGDYAEFSTDKDFKITANFKIAVSEYMIGQSGGGGAGDPAMTIGVPIEQYRSNYSFHAPTNYESSFANITAPAGAVITIDGQPVNGLMPIGASGYGGVRVQLSNAGDGDHTISGDKAFGVQVYGYGQYTSYWYPGGLDLNLIPQ
jgi:hypothetical protein